MKLTDLLKEAVAEISYKKSGLKNPNKADLDKDKNISSYEKKRGGAIEKNLKKEFTSQVTNSPKIRFGNEERPTQTMPSLSGKEMQASNSISDPTMNGCQECGAPMMYEDKMCAECGWMNPDVNEASMYGTDDIVDTTTGDETDGGGMGEGVDHEVSMAKSTLQNIVSNASQLLNKLGDEEIDIPAWVQDHITNASNYISQANDGYYEYEQGEEEAPDEEALYEAKKKPSAGLTKTQKSAIAKKASAGKDIGKKGKGFAAVEKKAKESGATNPKAVAAAAMWKGAAKRAHK